uniref:Putative DNA primase/helicase n=1 Tax=Pseudomonas fluorescens TaxID=294 RepID=A0A1W6C0K7_PSEFL|nr:LPD7 domain-containing protein [Pseudomonas fluorescens]ARJ57898.1 putative DNA primase/helicase [Pseudomonas fluorescens]
MSVESEALLQEFRQAVYEKHSSPQTAMESSPDGAIQHRAEAYQAWLKSSQSDGETFTIPDTLLRHWVVADITSWRSVDPSSAENAVTALHRNVFAYDTYAELLKELHREVYDQIISRSEVAESFNGFSSAGSPGDEPAKTDPSVILSELLKDITYRERRDGSVLYLLKEKPIFVDHGQQILMEASAQDDELAILAALHMAKQKFGGSIELTGSDEFKRRALEVMIKHNVQVELKNSAQDALRREMMGLPPIGDVPSGQDSAPAPDLTVPRNQSAQTGTSDSGKATTPADAPTAEAPAAEPVNHYQGEVLEFGSAPYQFDISNSRSFYVTLKNSDGEPRTTWGVDLERVIEEQSIERGDQVELKNLGRKDIIIEVPVRDTSGQVLRYEERKTHRNEWGIDVSGKASADVTPPTPLEPGESAIKAHDAKWLDDLGVPAETFDTHPKMLSMRGEDHAVLLLNGVETTPEGFATVEKLMAQEPYRAAFAASFESEFGRYNSHFQKQLADSEGYAIAKEMLADAETKYGVIPLAVIDAEALIQEALSKGDLDAVIAGIDEYDRQYLSSLENHRQAVANNNDHQGAKGGFSESAEPSVKPAADEPLTFTHNGEPATIDLERFKSPAELERRGYLSNDEKQAEDQAVNDPERLAELRVQHDQAAADRNQERGELWANREQATVEVERPAADEPLTFTHNGEPATIDLERFKTHNGEPAEVHYYDEEVERNLVLQEAMFEQEAFDNPAPNLAASEPLTFTHNGQPAEIDLTRYAEQPGVADEVEHPPSDLSEQHLNSASPLYFTHNGEPAEVDLSRFAQPSESDLSVASENLPLSSSEPGGVSDRSGVPFSERELQFAENLVPVEAHSWWEVQRVAIETWGKSLEEMEADLQILGPEPRLDQIIWFDKAGRQMPAPIDEVEWIAKQASMASQNDESNGFVSGDNTQLRGRGAASLFPSADGVIELNPEEADMAQSDSNAEKEPKLILRGVTKLDDDSFDTTVLLYQGKGDYLQGFVKVDGIKHQVLAFMNERHPDPKTGEIKPNFITLSEPSKSGTDDESKWNQIGYGNAVNRRGDGKEVHFDEVLFNVGGTIVKSKVTKHADEELHKKLGFLEPRKEREKPSSSPKDDAPAAGPVSEAKAPVPPTKNRVRA